MSFITTAWSDTIRARATAPELAAARRALDERVESYHKLLPDLPERQAGYYHEFFCPDHAVQLVYDPRRHHHHVCPIDSIVFSGEPYDAAWRWSVNDHLSRAALELAFRAFLNAPTPHLSSPSPSVRGTGGEARPNADRALAREILSGYAARYRTMPPAPRRHRVNPGVVTWHSLDEAVWLIRVTWAYALLGDHIPADADRAIREGLLRPGAEHMARVQLPGIHNATNWINGAIVTLGLALGDEVQVAGGLDGPVGVRAQLEQGVLADGFWWEGSLSYHYYSLAALIWTVRALRASGRAFGGDAVVRKMFAAPLEIAFPDLTLPAIHDCWYAIGLIGEVGHGIPNAAGFYEVAYGWYRDPTFAWLLQQNYARRPRAVFEALLDGADAIPRVSPPAFRSYHAVPSGLAVCRTPGPRERQTYLLLKAGPGEIEHGHPDQLAILLYAHGARLTTDLGTPGYGIGLNDTWYRHTASHSTVAIDGRSQPGHQDYAGLGARAAIGQFRASGEFGVVDASVSWDEGDYAGVRMRRVILWREAYFIDVFKVECAAEREIDWIYLNRGQLVEGPRGVALRRGLAGDCGYQHVDQVRCLRPARSTRLAWQLEPARLELFLPPAEEIYLGRAPSNPASETLSIAIRRRRARETVFLAVFAPAPADRNRIVRAVTWSSGPAAPRELIVETTTGHERWTIGLDPVEARLTREDT